VDERRQYGRGTYLEVGGIWNTYIGGRAMCSDGVVRTMARINPVADTYLSVPASVRVKGKTVSGYVSVDDRSLAPGAGDFDVEEPYVAFHACENTYLLPSREDRQRAEDLVAAGSILRGYLPSDVSDSYGPDKWGRFDAERFLTDLDSCGIERAVWQNVGANNMPNYDSVVSALRSIQGF